MIDAMSGEAVETDEHRRTSRRGPTFWLGTAMVLAGVVMLGYVGWQMWGTNYVSERKQRDAVATLERMWREAPAPADASEGGDETGAAEPASVPLGDASALIRIPRFGADYVMPVFEGVADDVLAQGFGHFDTSADPGEKGNYALAAHRVTHGEPLRDMPSLRPGDEVLVETRDMRYTYVLDTDPNDLVVTFRDVWVVDPAPVNPSGGVEPADEPRLITLTTCAELFHTDNRMIAFGHLVSAEEKAGAPS
jgi:sortase A